MPHLIVEHSANLSDLCDRALLHRLHAAVENSGLFPPGSTRCRAIAVDRFVVGNGASDNGFIDIEVRVRPGRIDADKQRLIQAISAELESHFAAAFEERIIGLTLELREVDLAHRYVKSNLEAHAAAATR